VFLSGKLRLRSCTAQIRRIVFRKPIGATWDALDEGKTLADFLDPFVNQRELSQHFLNERQQDAVDNPQHHGLVLLTAETSAVVVSP
jgi:hypothetical protein